MEASGDMGHESWYCCTLLEASEDSPAAFIIPLEGSSKCSPLPATPAERLRWSSPGGAWRAAAASVWRASLASRYARLLAADMLGVRGKRRAETKKIKHGCLLTFPACLKDDGVVAGVLEPFSERIYNGVLRIFGQPWFRVFVYQVCGCR